MNNILDANLKAISRYNSKLVEQIKELTSLQNNISLCETDLKEPNLTYNTVPIHSQIGAEIESRNIFDNSEDSPNYIHVVYGLGLGYLFKEFADRATGSVLLYEPDIEMLRVTLEIVDFTEQLTKQKVFITSDIDTVERIFYSIYSFSNIVKCHFLNYHRNNNLTEIQTLANELTRFNSILSSNYKFQKRQNYNFLKSTLSAFKDKIESTPLHLLKDSFKDIPAIIVSAGPSLGKNIQILKENQDKAIIFCVGTAYKTLIENGIKPDFLNAIEMSDCTTQFKEFNLEDVNFISEAYSNKNFHSLKYKKKFLTMSKENVANVWFGDITGNNLSEYETKGTVSYNALNSAKMLGCNPLILIGQDLAYPDGECYASGSVYSDLKCIIDPETNKPKIAPKDREGYRVGVCGENSIHSLEEQNRYIDWRLQELNSALTFVRGQNNEILTTEQGYALFIEYFKDFAKRYKDERLLVNSSIGGAQIDGFYNLPLADVLTKIDSKKPDVDQIISKLKYTPDYRSIFEKLKEEMSLASEITNILKHGQIDLRNFKREIQRHKTLTTNASKYLKNCLDSFLRIISDFKPKSHIISAITRDEESNLSWLIKEKDGKFDYNTQLDLIKSLEEYFYNNEKKFLEIQEEMSKIASEIQSGTQSVI